MYIHVERDSGGVGERETGREGERESGRRTSSSRAPSPSRPSSSAPSCSSAPPTPVGSVGAIGLALEPLALQSLHSTPCTPELKRGREEERETHILFKSAKPVPTLIVGTFLLQCVAPPAVERRWHMKDSQAQIMALAFRYNSLKSYDLFPLCL